MYSIDNIKKRKGRKKISVLTSYDYWTTLILNEAGIDIILVGDSLGMVMLGYENTLPVTMDEMIHHTKAVSRGNKSALIVGDMPFMSDICISEVVKNAGRFIKEGGAGAVKLEGGANAEEIIKAVVSCGIPVMGHIGLTPQDVLVMGGYKRQSDRERLLDDACKVKDAGAFCIVLECVPDVIAKEITSTLEIPTIGIGSGPYCDGQVLVTHDILGLCPDLTPKFVHPYVELKDEILKALSKWKNDINKEHS
jgi:3-methyl-2-oxobutanoate hydroxymethyltransferase